MEEQVKTVPFLGIKRNASIAQVEDGACDEIINLRFKEGSWRPVMDKVLLATLPDYDKVYKHNVEHTYDVWIGYNEEVGSPGGASGSIYSNINSVETLLFSIPFSEAFVSFSHIDNYVIVLTDLNKYILFWNGSEYVLLPDIPKIELAVKDISTYGWQTGRPSTFAEAYSRYLKFIDDRRAQGYYEGHMMIRVAYKLFDGTYIMHSQPYYIQLGCDDADAQNLQVSLLSTYVFATNASLSDPDEYGGVRTGYPGVKLLFDSSDITTLQLYSGIIKSIDVFGTYPLTIFDETTIGSDPTNGVNGNYNVVTKNSREYNETQVTYYLLKSVNLEDVSSDEMLIILPSPTEFITKTTLPIDNNSNHKLIASKSTIYNSRLHFADIKTKLGNGFSPFVSYALMSSYITNYVSNPPTYTDGSAGYQSITMKMFIYLQTDKGEKVIEQDIDEVYGYYNSADGLFDVILKPFICYPDSRCSNINIYVKHATNDSWIQWINLQLNPHPILNYAYKYLEYYTGASSDQSIFLSRYYDFPTYPINYAGVDVSSGAVTTANLPSSDRYYREPNRLQLSAINNPLYYPTINSYKIGNIDNVIYNVSPSISPVSETQFGEHPILVFTKGAIYAITIGSNDIVYSSIIPVVNEDFDSSSIFIPVKNGVVFTCDRGLKYIEGRQVLNIDNFIRERPDQNLIADTYFINIVTAPTIGNTITELQPYLSTVPFLDYLSGAKFAFDNEEEELIVSNSTYAYSYVYNFKTNSWHKISSVYSEFINLFPKYGGVILDGSYDKIYDMSDESSSVNTESIIITRPAKLNGEGYKKISGGLLRCNILDYSLQNKHQAFYIYGSVDGKVWKYLSGKQLINSDDNFNIGVNKHHVSCKYYIFVFAGHFYYKNTISLLELTFADVARNKLR